MQNDIKVRIGDDFDIKLEGSPMSGYIWEILLTKENSKLVKLKDTYSDIDKPLVGAPAVQTFVFKTLSVGSLALTFRYRRPWEKGNYLEDRTFYIEIVD
jgi:predicted secreted protein